MSDYPPHKVTILRESEHGSFTIISADLTGDLNEATWLAYDEMLGVIARMFCPVKGDGTPNRSTYSKPLFLKPAKPNIREVQDDQDVYWVRINEQGKVDAALVERAFNEAELEHELVSMRSVAGTVKRVLASRVTIGEELKETA